MIEIASDGDGVGRVTFFGEIWPLGLTGFDFGRPGSWRVVPPARPLIMSGWRGFLHVDTFVHKGMHLSRNIR